MKKKVMALAVLVGLSSPVMADDWELKDKLLLGTAVTALAVDWGQSRYISKFISEHPDCHCFETNPLLGKHPGLGRVNTYFATAIAGTIGLSLVLPPTSRRWMLGGITVVETVVIVRNNGLGVRVSY